MGPVYALPRICRKREGPEQEFYQEKSCLVYFGLGYNGPLTSPRLQPAGRFHAAAGKPGKGEKS
jgi:hypothetical protein